MAERKEDRTPDVSNIHIGSWIPSTPAKLHLPSQQFLCDNWQENHLVQAKITERSTQANQVKPNSSKSGRLLGNYLHEMQRHLVPACSGSGGTNFNVVGGGLKTLQADEAAANSYLHRDNLCSFTTLQAGEATISRLSVDDVFNFCQPHNAVNSHFYGEDFCKYGGIWVKDADKWTTSFGNLLPPANVADTIVADDAVSQKDFMATRSLSAPHFSPQTEGEYLESLLGAKFMAESNHMPDTFKADGIPSPSRILFDLNSAPVMIKDSAFINGKSGQFEPITPEKTNKVECLQKSAVLDSNIDEVPVGKNSQENKISTDEVRHLRKKVKNSKLNVDWFGATTSIQLQENDKPDNEGNKEASSTKTPQQRPRRRKHRPKVVIEGQPKRTPKPKTERHIAPKKTSRVQKRDKRKEVSITNDIPSEGESSGTDSSNTPARRKYGRTEGIEKPEPKMNSTPKIRSLKSIEQTRSSCRRSLNFDLENLVRESPCCSSANSDMEFQAEMELEMKKNHMGAYELTSSSDHSLEEYLSKPNIQTSPNLLPHKMDSTDDHMLTNRNICTRGKCQIVFSDVTSDKEEITAEVTLNPSCCWTPKSPSESNCSSTHMTQERQSEGLKRQYMSMTPETELCNSSFYNSCQSYFSIFSQNADNNDSTTTMHFPAIYKKRRTDKQNRPTSSLHCAVTASNNDVKPRNHPLDDSCGTITSKSNQGSFVSRSRGIYPQNHDPAYHRARNKVQTSKRQLALGPTVWIKKKRSKGPARIRNLASLIEVCKELPASSCNATPESRIDHKIGNLLEKHSCMEALIADICPTMTKKKRSNRSMLINSTIKNMSNQQKFACNPEGPLFTMTWKRMSLIGSVTEKLKQLNLYATSLASAQKTKALMVHKVQNEENYALVPYQSGGAVVPFDSLLEQVKTRQHRPKVDLDDETSRVWKLLLENINSEGIDGNDEENRKWWEEERKVFNGRADSFIARMHLIQGDRRFSPWKGSVVDSVIGVFLTQNVSDHLSSSAFMSLASHFPFKTKTNLAELYDEKVAIKVEEPETCVLDPEETFIFNTTLLNKPICGEDPNTLQDFDCDDIKTANNVDPPEMNFDDSIPHEDSRVLSEISTNGLVVSDEPITIKPMSFVGVQRELDDVISSQTSVISSQNSVDSPIVQTDQRTESYLLSTSEEEPSAEKLNKFSSTTSFVKLLQMAGTMLHGMSEKGSHGTMSNVSGEVESERLTLNLQNDNHFRSPAKPIMSYNYTSHMKAGQEPKTITPQKSMDVTGGGRKIDRSKMSDHKEVIPNVNDPDYHPRKLFNGQKAKTRIGKEKQNPVNWDWLRKQAQAGGKIREKMEDRLDTVDWDAVRCADVNETAKIIKDRGMNNMLAQRIKDFLNRLVKDHGSTDLEWLRDVPPDKAKEYLLSIQGLGLKSVECVRLLTLHQLAFPVDTNVGRISVRLGWVPLQPLPESLQLHLLELYPVLESIQKYLWPRLCKLDQRTLYELHYQMITFGKVFCTKNKPNCNACPMRGECRHFASAFASARLGLPAPEGKSIVSAAENKVPYQKSTGGMHTLQLPSAQVNQIDAKLEVSNSQPIIEEPTTPRPIIEVPVTPEPGHVQVPEFDIENSLHDDLGEIPTIQLNMEEFNHNLQKIMQQNAELQEEDMTKALVALSPQEASIPFLKLKNVSQLRTEHQVYELPDSHPLLEGLENRELDDPSPYLLAIWTPGETLASIDPPKRRCSFQDSNKLCTEETCSSCNSIREADSQTVRGTLLIPCRTAMRGSFPLNGTYFQVNEVFSDHESSLDPMDVPREWLWNMPRRTVYFGTSIPTIFKGLSTEGIQHCFWRGFVCVRGFDRRTRAPRPLIARLHFPASKLARRKGKMDEN